MDNFNDTNILLRSLIDKQKTVIDIQNHRMMGYLAIIDYISTLARSKDVKIPMDNVLALMEAKTDEQRQKLLVSLKSQVIHDVLDEAFNEAENNWQSGEYPVNSDDNWSSPEWDDGMYAPPSEEVQEDITKWKVFDRKWRMFGND
jgi:hypothetical protein